MSANVTGANTSRPETPPGETVPVRHRSATLADGRWRIAADVLRALTAAGVLLSAGIHLELWAEGFRQITVVGPLFMLNAAGGLLIGVALLLWRHWLTAAAAAAFGVATLVAFLISATVGLFGVHESFSGVPQVMCLVAEIVAAVCGGALAAMHLVRRR